MTDRLADLPAVVSALRGGGGGGGGLTAVGGGRGDTASANRTSSRGGLTAVGGGRGDTPFSSVSALSDRLHGGMLGSFAMSCSSASPITGGGGELNHRGPVRGPSISSARRASPGSATPPKAGLGCAGVPACTFPQGETLPENQDCLAPPAGVRGCRGARAGMPAPVSRDRRRPRPHLLLRCATLMSARAPSPRGACHVGDRPDFCGGASGRGGAGGGGGRLTPLG